ncbi:FAD-dependent monooxygenase [Pollutimonas bauzanensis]|uniref:2-octaprenyl-3-methyl-6-methoxy-1,4-benzoquinol hydroxylase n=1 Tax=Pollutimonas bauzanensis TaxID=658167 RepID=A0A1M5T8Q2_9BURK|nr:FAD-dependent monooxygenase [Pollutimonas bauzanensis]SHH47092.1 2-octaprenyl-3-methyl-6-methoxy-1,4-benzoquinol hydroxylase [Pollutimonas bauzanensis]
MSKASVLVCGSGIAGLAAALGLARGGFDTALIGPRAAPAPAPDDVYCPRVYAISCASQAFLARLGVWDMMDARRLTAVEAMEIHGDGGGALNLHAWQAAQPALAWIVESSAMEYALRQAVQVFGVTWHAEKFQRLESGMVFTDTGRALKADLLVGADGAQSPVRSAAGIPHESRPYGDMGLVVHLNAELPHQNVALQWFTGDSILALLPLPDTAEGHQVSMVWSMPESMAKELMALPEARRDGVLETRLAAASGGRLGRLRVRSPLFGFPLFLEHSGMVAPGVALVSDAAHRVHPLAGQGLNLGLADVEELLRVLGAKEAYRKAGDLRVLHRYRRARAEPLLAMRVATDGLHRLFAAQAAPVAWARNAGMQCADRLPFIKRFLIGGASGQ